MSEPSKAVFLSYAREDAVAAQRIVEALRAAGLEVWFDQSELRGGEAWDQSIRRQIKACALFVPLISAHTEDRHEGYFRLEWSLAEERTHLMARGLPFILPVVIDGTNEARAVVPERFREVQWFRLLGGEPKTEFLERVKRLIEQPRKSPFSGHAVRAPEPAAPMEISPPETRRYDSLPTRPQKRHVWIKAALAVVAMAAAVAILTNRKPASEGNGTAAATGPTKTPALQSPEPVAAKSVAVLAFANLSDDKDNEYFSDGISEELLNVLAKVPGLKVSARTSAFSFKGKGVAIPEIAQQLGVAYVVEGSVRKAGNRVRITAQLIKASDGFHVWSDNFDRELKDIFAVQDEIAGLIAGKLQVAMGGVSRPARTVDAEAHRLVLEGRYFWNLRTVEGFDRARTSFAKAAEIDPGFGEAQTGLAGVELMRVVYRQLAGQVFRWEPALVEKPARQAIALDPASAEPHAILAYGLFLQDRLTEAAQEFERALRLNPNDATALSWQAFFELNRGRLDVSLALYDRATELDPLWIPNLYSHAIVLVRAGQYARALALAERVLALRPEAGIASVCESVRANALFGLGRREEAIAQARALNQRTINPVGPVGHTELIAILLAGGYTAEVRAQAEVQLAQLPPENFARAFHLVALDRVSEALVSLENIPPVSWNLLYWNNALDPIRNDPRFGQLLTRLGRAEDYKTARAALTRIRREPGEDMK